MTEQFVPQTITAGPVTKDMLEQFAANDLFLFENMPKVMYTAGVVRTKGLKIMCGKTLYAADTTKNYVNVLTSFRGFFSVGAAPVVVATAYSRKNANKMVSIRSIDQNVNDVDHRGFNATVYSADSTVVESAGVIHWIAIGI